MEVLDTPLSGLKIVKLNVYGDERGFFVERFSENKFLEHDLPSSFVQDNHSRSAPNVLRGLHYQHNPNQGKLVGVINGSIWDVAVDIRPDSSTYGQYFGIDLTDINGTLLWIPAGFAHGFCVTGDKPADVLYKVDGLYNPEGEGGYMWNDPAINIEWPIKSPIISERDKGLSSFN